MSTCVHACVCARARVRVCVSYEISEVKLSLTEMRANIKNIFNNAIE